MEEAGKQLVKGDKWNNFGLPTIFLCLFTLTNYLSVQSHLNIQINNVPEKLAIVALVLHVILSILKKESLLSINWPMISIIVVYAIGMALVDNAVDPVNSQEVMRELVKAIVFYILVSNAVNTLTDYKIYLTSVCLGGFLLAYKYISSPLYNRGRAFLEGSPLAGDPNDITMVLAYSIPLVIVLIKIAKQKWSKALLAYFMFIMLLGIVEGSSRGGFLAIAAMSFAFIFTVQGFKKKIIFSLVLVTFGCVFILRYAPQRYVDRILEITDLSEDRTGSASIRGENMLISIDYIRSNMFSEYGPGNNGYMILARKGYEVTEVDRYQNFQGQHVHSIFLQIGADMGSVGLLLYIIFIFGNFYLVVKSKMYFIENDNKIIELRHIRIAVMISFIGFISAGLFLPIAYRLYTFYIMGICAGFYNMSKRRYYLSQDVVA